MLPHRGPEIRANKTGSASAFFLGDTSRCWDTCVVVTRSGVGGAPSSQWLEAGDAAKHLTTCRMAPTAENGPAPQANMPSGHGGMLP